MSILEASNNGGRYNNVHNQTDDGLIISVVSGKNLLPLVFRYDDYLGCATESVLSASAYPHKRLMRGDCGWRVEDDSVDISYSWDDEERVTDGFSEAPSGEYVENYHNEYNRADDVVLGGFKGHRSVFYRKDREYWTPDTTLQADSEEELFGFSQWNPISCAPKQPNKCGIVEFYDPCDKSTKARANACNKKGLDKYGNELADAL